LNASIINLGHLSICGKIDIDIYDKEVYYES